MGAHDEMRRKEQALKEAQPQLQQFEWHCGALSKV